MDKRLHSLVHTSHGLINGMLLGTLLTCQSIEWLLDIIHQRLFIEILVTLTVQILKGFQFLNIAHTDIGCQIEVEGRNRLSAMHLVLTALHGDTGQHRSCFDTLGRARGTMTGNKATVKDIIQRMLHTGERLGGIVVLIMDMEIVVLYGITALFGEQIVINKGLRGL